MRRPLAFVLVASLAVVACSPGPHDNPAIGLLALGLATVLVVTVIGGIAWLLRNPGRARLPTLIQGLARSLGATLVVSAVVAGLLYVGLQLRWPFERPFAYWAIDDQTLQVVLLDAPNLGCQVTGIDESSDAVRIHAQCGERVLPVPQTGMAQKYVLQVSLPAPLAGRTVYDGSGNLALRCQAPGPDCTAPG